MTTQGHITTQAAGLAGKVALVTGGASGIGAGIARVLAAAGARVAIGDLDGTAATIMAAGLPEPGLGVRLDVTDRGSTDHAITAIERELGAIDVLVNNAGISSVAPFLDISDQDWDRLMAVNLRGVFVVTQRVLPQMLQRHSGRIINISSMAGKEGLRHLAHYCASKFGVIGLTQSLAKEVAAHNVTVNAVCPGVVRTPLWDHPDTGILRQLDGENGWQAFVSGIPLGRPQTADDIGHACAYLASDAAANVTGEALNVSGGQQMH
ncbi:MAG TPA: SDR family NAD(P)-dependent oxidoreductase [Streptosporangiaceae bacterium]|nr:SDR family NAD(P)-dependent oxidoreductase [Streptosporangiaceae bacterium]